MKMVSLFKIPTMRLQKIQSSEQRFDYIIDHMVNNIREGLRFLKESEAERTQNIKLFKKELRDQFNDEQFRGLYSWL